MEYSVERQIAASPEAVWAVLADGAKYVEWDPNIEKLDGTIALGETITVHTKLSSRAFPVKVTRFDANAAMEWTGGMPLGLFKGVRRFTLSAKDGGTEFIMREVFSGLLLPLIGRTIPDLSESFEEFADGLKARAEGAS